MPKKTGTRLKPLNFEKSETRRPLTRSQQISKTRKPPLKHKLSFSQNDTRAADLIFDDDSDDDIPLKKLKLSDALPEKNILKLLIPTSSSELAIHAKKIEEVKEWLEECNRLRKVRPNPVLLVTGPCGAGKLTCVKVVAEENGFDVYEYVAPLDNDINWMDMEDGDREYPIKEGQVESFMKFLRESKYGTIFNTAKQRKLILCKDIPNIFYKEPETFQKMLEEYSRWGRAPLIFITNDSKGKHSKLNYKLFNDENILKYQIAQITFNPVSYMLLLKHLKLVTSKIAEKQFRELYNVPSSEMIESIIVSSQGDLRNATINLLFACQKGAIKMETENKMSNLTKTKQAKKYKNLGTDENVSMMHLLGKVFHPKYEKIDGIDCLTNDPETLTDIFSTQTNTCLKMIFVNYSHRFTNMDDVARNANFLSTSDLLMNEWRDEALSLYGLDIGIRATMLNNSEPVSSYKAGAIRGYKNIFSNESHKSYGNPLVSLSKKPEKFGQLTENLYKTRTCDLLPSATYICDCLTYANIIKNDPLTMLLDFNEEVLEDDTVEIESFDEDSEFE